MICGTAPPGRPQARSDDPRLGPRRLLAPAMIGLVFLAPPVLCGCGTPAGPVFDPDAAVYRWPPAPDTPRIRYVGALTSSADLKPATTFFEDMGAALFGKDDARTMLSPIGVCTDGAQRVFIADSNAQVVHMFDLETRRYEQWRPPEDGPRFSQPVAVAYDPAGRLMVSDSVGAEVYVFDRDGRFTGTMGAGKLVRPCGLAVDSVNKRLFVADAAAHQIVVLNLGGEEIRRLGERGTGPGQFNFPTNVALDSGGRLFVSDTLNFRVQVFGSDLSPIRQMGRKGDMPGYFSQPKGLAVDRWDHLYVVDANFEAIQVFDPEGTFLMSLGGEGHGPGEFWLPAGIHVDLSGRIWIADSYNRRVQVFEYLSEEPRR